MSLAEQSRTTTVVQGAIASEALFVSEDDIGYVAGQAIRLVPITELLLRDHLIREDLIYQIPHVNYGFFRTCPNKRIFCIASLHPTVTIFIHRFPDFKEMAQIDGAADTELLDVEFTYTKLLLTLSGRPENLMKIWNWDTREHLCSVHLPNVFVPNIRLSSSTWNWRDFCLTGDNTFRIFSIDHSVSTEIGDARVSTVTERPFQIPYSQRDPSKSPQDLFQCLHCANPDDFFSLESIAQVTSDVTATFVDEILERRRLIPTSHSWHVDGGLYIGTNEGRVLYFYPHKCSAPVVTLTIDLPTLPIRNLHATKYGLAILMQDGSYYFASMPSATEVSQLRLPLGDIKVTELLVSPSCEKTIALTEDADMVQFEPPENDIKKTLYNSKDFGKYLTVGKFCGGGLYTLQDLGVLKIWNYNDEPEFVYQLQVPMICVAASPAMDYLAVGTSNGYVHILDCHYCHNGRVPRLIHSVRLFDSAIRRIRFDSDGQVIMITAEKPAYKMVILAAQASASWKVLGFVKMSGSILDYQGVKDQDGNIFVAVSLAGNPHSHASNLATFRLSPTLIDDPGPFHSDTKDEFSPKCITYHKLKMKVDFTSFAVHQSTSIVFATTTKHLVHAHSDTWTKTPDIITQCSNARPVVQVDFLPEQTHVFSVTSKGAMTVRLLEDLSVVHSDDASVGNVKEALWKQDQGGFHVYHVTHQGELIVRTMPFLSSIETERRDVITDAVREDAELLKSLPSSENDFVVRYEDAERYTPQENTDEESWLTRKLRLFEEAKHADHLARSTAMKDRFAHLKRKLMRYYEHNETVNSLQRLPDEWFDLLDDKFVRLKKKRESGIAKHQLKAALEVIEHRLMKEKLIGRYLARLTTQRQCLYSLNSKMSLSNFPVPRRTHGMMKTAQIAELRRNLEKDSQEKAEQLPSTNRVRTNSVPTNFTDFLSGYDYVLQTMAVLCDDEEATSKLSLFEDLYFDDVVTSCIQRVHQVVLLRECEWLLKEAFNRKFDELMSRKRSTVQMLAKRMDALRGKLEDANHGLTLPSMDLLIRNDEDPRKTLYQVTDEQILERLTKDGVSIPLNFGRSNKNQRIGTPVQPSTSAFLLSRTQIPTPLDDTTKSPEVLIRECVEAVLQFDKDLLGLQRLKDRVTFAVGMVQLRAMYLRVRMQCINQIALHSEHLSAKIKETSPKLSMMKANILRSKKVVDHIKMEYDKIVQNDATLDHYVKNKLHEVSDLDGRLLVQIYRKRPHPLRGLKQMKHFNGQIIRPRSSELRESVTADFFETVAEIEDTVHRPEDIDLKTWIKFCELRRRKMECEMEFWMKHLEMDQHHGVLKDYVTLEKMLQQEVDTLNGMKSKAENTQRLLTRNADFVMALKHGQVEVELKPFEDFNTRVIAVPLSRIEEKNATLQMECKKKMEVLTELVKHKEAVVLLEWEKEVHQQTIADYEYEKHFVESQAAPLDIRNMVGKDFEELRKKKEAALLKSMEQQEAMFEKELKLAAEKVQQLKRKLERLRKERQESEAATLELTVDLVEQHAIGEHIGIHADATESDLRRDLVLRRLRLQGYAKEQKKRMLELQQILLRWQKRTFPSIERDKRVN